MRIHMNARSARSAVLGVAVVAALATGGLAYGSSADDVGTSTVTAKHGKAAPAVSKAGTASMVPKKGVKTSRTIPAGTAERTPPATRGPAHTAKARDLDKSDRGVKGAKTTKDSGKTNVPATRDLGAR
jgi:hypothetical protein